MPTQTQDTKKAEWTEVCFYSYNVFDHNICEKFTLEMPTPKSAWIRNPKTNQLEPDAENRHTIEFVQWIYRTNKPDEIQFLRSYNKRVQSLWVAAPVLITTEILYPNGVVVQKVGDVEVKEVTVMSSLFLWKLSLESIIELADMEFKYKIKSPTVEEAIEEMKNLWFAK